jgi:hypothetical protein
VHTLEPPLLRINTSLLLLLLLSVLLREVIFCTRSVFPLPDWNFSLVHIIQVFKVKYDKKYYYDIQRTKKESYKYHWQVLNQVASSETVTEPPEEPPAIYLNLPK